jgi:peptide/nickel transport system ATP-binding protein
MTVVAATRDLEVTFPTRDGEVAALRGVSVEIERSEILAVVGESGSGKTIFGLSLLGLLPRTPAPRVRGSVQVCGTDMLGGSTRARRNARRWWLGAVFQDPLTSLNPTMRIGRQLLERDVTVVQAIANLREAGISEAERRLRQFPHELSGGLRQRAMIGMAISVPDEPRLIVADEPTTALDVSVQAQVVLLFDRIRRDFGCSVVFVTHDLGVAASIADRVAVFYAGRIREIGPTRDVLERPEHPYTRDLLASRLSVGQIDATSIAGDPPDPRVVHRGCAYAPRCSNAQADCLENHPPLAPRDGAGAAACFHRVGEEHHLAVRDGRRLRTVRGREPVLGLTDVSKTFRLRSGRIGLPREELHAVDGVSLEVPAGGAVALVGESGCGKTTTLRIATGLIEPDHGSVEWAAGSGRPQLVFQDAGSSLTPWLRIGAQIEEWLRAARVPRARRAERMSEVLGLVGLDARTAAARPRDLSGGQRQRAAIARALATEPRVLICDEPVSALDASLVIRVLELLEALRERLGIALLIVTHDLAVARRIADDVAVMYRGRIVERGPVAQIFENPAHPYTEGLLAAIPTTEVAKLAPTLAGEPPAATGHIVGCSFASRCSYVRDRCRVDDPPLYEVSSTRGSACHYFAEMLAKRSSP